jgi:hypothetical protein
MGTTRGDTCHYSFEVDMWPTWIFNCRHNYEEHNVQMFIGFHLEEVVV